MEDLDITYTEFFRKGILSNSGENVVHLMAALFSGEVSGASAAQCVYLKGTGDRRVSSFILKAAGQASEEELICASLCNSSVSSGGIFPLL